MPGGLIQLSAYGRENHYMMGNPQITFYKTIFKRHTNFAVENFLQYFEGVGDTELDLEKTSNFKVKVGKNGDLIKAMYLCFTLPAITSNTEQGFAWIENVGTSIIDKIECYIGGQLIDTLHGEWLSIQHAIRTTDEKVNIYNKMTGNVVDVYRPDVGLGERGYPISFYDDTDVSVSGASTTNPKYVINNTSDACSLLGSRNAYGPVTGCCDCTTTSYGPNTVPSIFERHLYIPLPFWFSKDNGLAFPLLALEYQDMEIRIQFKSISDLYTLNSKYTVDNSNLDIGTPIIKTIRTRPNQNNPNHFINNFIGKNVKTSKKFKGWGFLPHLNIEYVFLDKAERKMFATYDHEYLIEQNSRQEFYNLSGKTKLDLDLFFPVKELIWVPKRNDAKYNNEFTNFTNLEREDVNPYLNDPDGYPYSHLFSQVISNKENYNKLRKEIILKCKLQFNNKDRIKYNSKNSYQDSIEDETLLPYEYFTMIQPYQHHRRSKKDGIYIYSFSLHPDQIQPSGFCNMSRIPNISLHVETRNPPLIYEARFPDNKASDLVPWPKYLLPGSPSALSMMQDKYQHIPASIRPEITLKSPLWEYDIHVYIINYNILSIKGGMADLTFKK